MCILNEGEAVLNPSHQYSICLYIEKESYNSLSTVSAKFLHELKQLLKEGYRASDGTIWPIELFFSGDWKFVALILGINAAMSNYFCLYCNCHKDERHNMDKVWLNSKTHMEFTNKTQALIIEEMKKLHVHFEFYPPSTKNGKWDWTSLMGPDKKKILKDFQVRLFFGGTTMGGRKSKRPVIHDIFYYENYYQIHDTPIKYTRKSLEIKT
ncbi:hypothetical protein RhiirC2_706182 [Rhizophagus irregularis]|uniref:Uncharacterized protein n=1 Tax=Rhizophagus irregularis TaxID=588596 RepID=A0A2N1NVM2_9GLOM|nr:hypothetical protein RhiirC2_706182 [Rhizophagus irregularis]